jgi:two-component system, cell cycle response regulator
LDGLKKINDTHGHLEGDQALFAAATILKDTFRSSDVIARIGGDEFAVAVLQDQEDSGEEPLLKRLQQKLEDFNSRIHKNYTLGISVGTAELKPRDQSAIDTLLAQADKKLYAHKNANKMRIIQP